MTHPEAIEVLRKFREKLLKFINQPEPYLDLVKVYTERAEALRVLLEKEQAK